LTYIGQQPATTFDSGIQDRFTGLSSNTVTLTHEISAEEDILVVWNNIVQDKNTYSVGGTGNKTLTLGGTLVSADVVTVYYLNKVMQSVNPTANSVGITELNVSDGSNGQVLQTNGSGTLSFATPSSFNADQAQTFNDSGADADFRVEGDTNTHLLFLDASNDSVNINASTTGAKFLVGVADNSGTTAPSSYGSKNMVIGKQSEGIHFAWDDTNNKGYIGSLEPGVEWRHLTLNSDGGTVSIGTNAVAGSFKHEVRFSGNPGYGMILSNSANVASTEYISFRCGSTQEIGSIKRDGGGDAIAFNTSSDYRLKQDIVDIDDGITRLKTLQPKRFKWKSDTSRLVDGFIAHEVTAVPESITGTKDETENKLNVVIDNSGSIIDENKTEQEWTVGKTEGKYPSNSTWSASKSVPKYQQIDQAKLVPLLTAALQEAVTKIEALEARVKTLEDA